MKKQQSTRPFALPLLLIVSSVICMVSGFMLKITLCRDISLYSDKSCIAIPFFVFNDRDRFSPVSPAGGAGDTDGLLSFKASAVSLYISNAVDKTVRKNLPTLPEEETPEQEHGAIFSPVDADYFQDALFIGDSRTVGLYEYGQITGATYFAATSMTVFNLMSVDSVDTLEEDITLGELLQKGTYGKIYIMLGINELGYSMDDIIERYAGIVAYLRSSQPKAVIILEANLHVSEQKARTNPIFSAERVDELNSRIAALADEEHVFYLDVNPVFDNKNGYLNEDYTSDGAHLLAKYCVRWGEWIAENGVTVY